MTIESTAGVSPLEMTQRFDLLATDAKEYAVFLAGLDGSNIIGRQVEVMVRLVDDLLDIGRITKGKLRLSREKVELRVVINDAAESVRPLMHGRLPGGQAAA